MQQEVKLVTQFDKNRNGRLDAEAQSGADFCFAGADESSGARADGASAGFSRPRGRIKHLPNRG